MKRILLAVCTCTALSGYAQVTTSSIQGTITDNSGETLIGATVQAVHTPSGTEYGTTTRDDGRYTLPNLRIGGPYTVNVSYVGYEDKVSENIFLNLGQKFTLDVVLEQGAQVLEEVIVTAEGASIINSDRTGSQTNVTRDQLSKLPTISRSAQDYTRLTPASDGNSFAGRNDQFNNFSLDGSIFNNPFGLDAATPGGQTEAQPISLDAIDQINIAIAPYDVTQAGFTGASVNAVTKSGTNNFSGTVFGYFRNDGLTGGKVNGEDVAEGDLEHLQYGFSLGGPIIRNKLFFFVNAEVEDRDDLATTWIPAGANASGQVSRVTLSDMQAVANALSTRFGYDSGDFYGFTHNQNSVKGIAKIDWAINQSHTFTATYNFLDAEKDKPAHPSAGGRRGPDFTTLQMQNAGYQITNKIQSGIIELRSVFGNKFANKLQVGYTRFEDFRNPFSTPFPATTILKDGIPYIIAGHEPFSIHNRLDQDVLQFTDNFNIYTGDHTLTVGTSLERFSFLNSFNLGVYGGFFAPAWPSAQDFVEAVNAGDLDDVVSNAQDTFDDFGGDNGVEGEGWALAEMNVGQWGIYAQDEWQVSNDFRVSFGVRLDIPLYFNTDELAQENIDRNPDYAPEITWYDEDGNPRQFDNTVMPDNTPLVSPRIGFNWDVRGDESAQLRGGTGFFSGRLPFVWIGNHIANPNWFFYNYTLPDFKFPQVWRTNIGYDQELGSGWTGTIDLIYTDDLQAAMVRNYGLKPPTGTLQGVGDNRPVYTFNDRAVYEGLGFPIPVSGYVLTNTDIGYSFNAGIQLRKTFNDNSNLMLGYNYLKAEDATSIEAEISSDAFDRNPANIEHVNRAVSAPSIYGAKHRFIGTYTNTFYWGSSERTSTTIGVFFEYAQGGTTQNDNIADYRFGYTYSGDINGDGAGLNDILYIPTDSELDQQQWVSDDQREAFRRYIEQDEYLRENRGEYAEKYGILAPWYSQWDLRILQDIRIGSSPRPNHVQFSIDIINLGNLINSDWGVRDLPNNSQPVAVSVDENGVPTYSFDPSLKDTFSPEFGLLSRWQMQLGLRYIF